MQDFTINRDVLPLKLEVRPSLSFRITRCLTGGIVIAALFVIVNPQLVVLNVQYARTNVTRPSVLRGLV